MTSRCRHERCGRQGYSSDRVMTLVQVVAVVAKAVPEDLHQTK